MVVTRYPLEVLANRTLSIGPPEDPVTITYLVQTGTRASGCRDNWAARVQVCRRGSCTDYMGGCSDWLGEYLTGENIHMPEALIVFSLYTKDKAVGYVDITVIKPAEFDIIQFSVGETSSAGKSSIETDKDTSIFFKMSVKNIGELTGSKKITIYDGNIPIWSNLVELGPAESKDFNLIDTPLISGTHQYCAIVGVDIVTQRCVSVQVTEPMLIPPPSPPECVIDADCPTGFECSNGICMEILPIPPGCFIDSDCPSGQKCQNGVCVPIEEESKIPLAIGASVISLGIVYLYITRTGEKK